MLGRVPDRWWLVVGCAVGLASAACQSPLRLWPFNTAPPEQTAQPASADDSIFSAASYAPAAPVSGRSLRPSTTLGVQLDVLRMELPIDTVRHSLKVWNHVDELRSGPDSAALLARNGMRLGVATQGAWPAIRTIFEACGAGVRDSRQITTNGPPVSVELGAVEPGQSVFSFDSRGRLKGQSFQVGQRLVHLSCTPHPGVEGVTDVTVSFEILIDRGLMEWRQEAGVIRQVPAYDHYEFDGLSTTLTLRPGEFLVIGPGDASDNPYLVGGRFFSGDGPAGPCETVLCITPKPWTTAEAG